VQARNCRISSTRVSSAARCRGWSSTCSN